jgi:DNA helicase IV
LSTPLIDLDTDRRDVARFYSELDRQFAEAQTELTDRLRGGTGSSPGERTTHGAALRNLRARITRLGAGRDGLCLGWIETAAGERTHIGRIGLLDAEFEPLVIDWRAPAARPFYTATAAHPEGLVHRRHLRTRGREVLGAHDDLAGGRGADLALLDAVDAPRTGAMRDIVATIQREQDEVIRFAAPGTLVIEGGPGTGKTAVALHRVAYLLYTRPVLARRGVLVIGPHPRLLRYIDQVLPALGESDVVFATMGSLLPGLATTAVDPAAAAKGSLAMVDVLAAAVADRQELPAEPRPIELDDVTVEVDREVAGRARELARATGALHNEARPVFVDALLDGLAEQAVDRIGAGWLAPRETPGLAAELRADARDELRAHPAFRATVDALWPRLTPARLLAELFSSPERLAAVGADLYRADGAAWTVSDVPLLDEAAELLGRTPATPVDGSGEERDYAAAVLQILEDDMSEEAVTGISDLVAVDDLAGRWDEVDTRSTAERAAADREWVYGHVVVDEAQELSAMDWRMLVRRCPTRSFTVVGDLAQRRADAGARHWSDVVGDAAPGRWTLRRLTVDYRTPAEIVAVARDVLAEYLPGHPSPEPVRSTGTVPWSRRVDDLERAVREAVEPGAGTTAVITPGPLPEIPGATVLTPAEAKGLEFDSVLVVEPDEILAVPADLYVALTRATQRLGVLHTRDLPRCLHALRAHEARRASSKASSPIQTRRPSPSSVR